MTIRLIVALLLAGMWQIRLVLVEVLAQCRIFVKAFKEAINPKFTVSYDIQVARMRECEKCPIFYKPLRTCGSVMMRKTWPDDKMLGCGCQMEFKVKTHCSCWLFLETDGKMGWLENLNDPI